MRLRFLVPAVVAIAVAGGVGYLLWPGTDCCAAQPALDGFPVEVPSGQAVAWIDTIQNTPDGGLVYRFRFLAPGIAREGGTVSPEAAQKDMQFLCDTFALPRLPDIGQRPDQIIVSLSDRPVKFGEPNPDVTQFFESYRIENGACVWELF